MMNMYRPQCCSHNLYRLVHFDIVQDIVIWNSSKTPISYNQNKVLVINASQDIGLCSRFYSALLCQTKNILLLDDDVFPDEQHLIQLYNEYVKNPDVIHGFWGRNPKKDYSYADIIDHVEKEVQIVLTKCAMYNSKYNLQIIFVIKWLQLKYPKIYKIINTSGDDLLLNHIITLTTHSNNYCHKPIIPIDFKEDDNVSLCCRKNHIADRTLLLKWFKDNLSDIEHLYA